MAKYTNTNKRVSSREEETNYSKAIFQGETFATVEEAIEVGAKTYAKQEWTNITKVIAEYEELTGESLNLELLAESLVNVKRNAILAVVERRSAEMKAFL